VSNENKLKKVTQIAEAVFLTFFYLFDLMTWKQKIPFSEVIKMYLPVRIQQALLALKHYQSNKPRPLLDQ